MIDTHLPGFSLRFADPDDVPLILRFIEGLADFERLSDECVATEDGLRKTLFGEDRYAEVVLGYYESIPVGFALFFHTYSTFLARPGIYLEDLFILPEWRGRGYGRTLLAFLAKLAVERDCGRLEWAVLDWNEDAVRFYRRLGAKPLDEWTTFRLAGGALRDLASTSPRPPSRR
ncbi:MAG: GNAT family N-acetyltransferase [Rhodothermales bacterium]